MKNFYVDFSSSSFFIFIPIQYFQLIGCVNLNLEQLWSNYFQEYISFSEINFTFSKLFLLFLSLIAYYYLIHYFIHNGVKIKLLLFLFLIFFILETLRI